MKINCYKIFNIEKTLTLRVVLEPRQTKSIDNDLTQLLIESQPQSAVLLPPSLVLLVCLAAFCIQFALCLASEKI